MHPFFRFLGGFPKSYIDELPGGSCPHTLAPFGHISSQICKNLPKRQPNKTNHNTRSYQDKNWTIHLRSNRTNHSLTCWWHRLDGNRKFIETSKMMNFKQCQRSGVAFCGEFFEHPGETCEMLDFYRIFFGGGVANFHGISGVPDPPPPRGRCSPCRGSLCRALVGRVTASPK